MTKAGKVLVLTSMVVCCTKVTPVASELDGGPSTDSASETGTTTEIDEPDSGPIVMDCSDCPDVGGSLDNMVCAIDLCHPDAVLSTEYSTPSLFLENCTLEETYEAVAHFGLTLNDLAPKLNDSYALMATGRAEGVAHESICDHYPAYSTIFDEFAPWETWPIYDIFEWRLEIKAPPDAQAFRFKYVFFSEEYDDFISSPFNDKFYVVLESQSTAAGQPTVINFTTCRDPDLYHDFVCGDAAFGCQVEEEYCYIAINSALSECCWYPRHSVYVDGSNLLAACPDGPATTDISGTGFHCAEDKFADSFTNGSSTGWLQTAWPIQGGETFFLTFHIHDTNDARYDSEVIIDAFEFLHTPEQGTVVVH